MKTKIPRRDRVYAPGIRAVQLSPAEMAHAWNELANQLIDFGEQLDTVKFRDVLSAIRKATISAKVHAARLQNVKPKRPVFPQGRKINLATNG